MDTLDDIYHAWRGELLKPVDQINIDRIAELETAAYSRGASLVQILASGALVAAPWDADRHPRGKDGKFIELMGWVNLTTGSGNQDRRGQVTDISPDPANPGKPKITVELEGENGVPKRKIVVTPDKILSAPNQKARLDTPRGKGRGFDYSKLSPEMKIEYDVLDDSEKTDFEDRVNGGQDPVDALDDILNSDGVQSRMGDSEKAALGKPPTPEEIKDLKASIKDIEGQHWGSKDTEARADAVDLQSIRLDSLRKKNPTLTDAEKALLNKYGIDVPESLYALSKDKNSGPWSRDAKGAPGAANDIPDLSARREAFGMRGKDITDTSDDKNRIAGQSDSNLRWMLDHPETNPFDEKLIQAELDQRDSEGPVSEFDRLGPEGRGEMKQEGFKAPAKPTASDGPAVDDGKVDPPSWAADIWDGDPSNPALIDGYMEHEMGFDPATMNTLDEQVWEEADARMQDEIALWRDPPDVEEEDTFSDGGVEWSEAAGAWLDQDGNEATRDQIENAGFDPDTDPDGNDLGSDDEPVPSPPPSKLDQLGTNPDGNPAVDKYRDKYLNGLDDYGKTAAKGLSDDELDQVIAWREDRNSSNDAGLSGTRDLQILNAERDRRKSASEPSKSSKPTPAPSFAPDAIDDPDAQAPGYTPGASLAPMPAPAMPSTPKPKTDIGSDFAGTPQPRTVDPALQKLADQSSGGAKPGGALNMWYLEQRKPGVADSFGEAAAQDSERQRAR
jgi:hypothetical protein